MKPTFRYGSKASAFQAIIQGPEPEYLPGTATQVGVKKTIVAEFAEQGGEFDVLDANGDALIDPGTGRPVGKTANIRGHYFDSRMQQEAKGWTDAEHDRVVARLEFLCTTQPGQVWRLEAPRFGEPLPGWDGLSAARKLALAGELGVVGEALNYERQEAADLELVGRLEKKLAVQAAEAEAEDALTAA